ncbi:MAG TPA: class I SAM-dependent methyltransferase [Gemmataceae bacterium]|jgi:predicted O-methyltransferase YrrM
MAIPLRIDDLLPQLAEWWGTRTQVLGDHLRQLEGSREFLEALNAKVRGVPEFAGVRFTSPADLRLYRSLLYLFTRVTVPEVYVETGVLNGFATAFTLLAMHHNGKGTLYSIDLPPADERIIAQGTTPLPAGKGPGWAIPDFLRDRHRLLLGRAQVMLPRLLEEHGQVDCFLHDSDHSYEHMMFEMALAWQYLRPGGWLLVDNIEANDSFADFARGVRVPGRVVASFDSPERTWRHGMARRVVGTGESASAR